MEYKDFVKGLVSNEPDTRRHSFGLFVGRMAGCTQLDIGQGRRLWTALFYGLWMSDTREEQDRIADMVSLPILSLELHLLDVYLDSFWFVLMKEYKNIDYLRLSKFYNLIQKIEQKSIVRVVDSSYDNECIDIFNNILCKYPLNVSNRLYDLSFYLVEYFGKIVEKETASNPMNCEQTSRLFSPFINLIFSCPKQGMVDRIQRYLFNEDFYFHNNILERAFEIASKKDVSDHGRMSIYSIYKAQKNITYTYNK